MALPLQEMSILKRKRRANIFTKIVIVGLMVYAVVTLVNLHGQITDVQERKQTLQTQLEDATNENAALKYNLEHVDDPETIEDIARDRLGLVLPGEIIFYDINK